MRFLLPFLVSLACSGTRSDTVFVPHYSIEGAFCGQPVVDIDGKPVGMEFVEQQELLAAYKVEHWDETDRLFRELSSSTADGVPSSTPEAVAQRKAAYAETAAKQNAEWRAKAMQGWAAQKERWEDCCQASSARWIGSVRQDVPAESGIGDLRLENQGGAHVTYLFPQCAIR